MSNEKFLKQDSGLLKSAQSFGILGLIAVIGLVACFGCGQLSAKGTEAISNTAIRHPNSTDTGWPLLHTAQIKAGLGVLQDMGHPTPIPTPTTVKGTKSNSDKLSSTRPVENVTDNMGVSLFTTSDTSRSNTYHGLTDVRGGTLQLNGTGLSSVGVLELKSPMLIKDGPGDVILTGQYRVGIYIGTEVIFLAMSDLETGVLGTSVSIGVDALLQALGDDFMDAQGIPCLLGDEYTSAILLNLLASMLVEKTSALDLSLQMTLDTKLIVGQPVTFTATVTNSGGAPTTGTISVTDTLPSTLILDSIKGNGFSCLTFNQQTTCSNSTVVASGASLQLQFMALVKGGEGGVASGTEIKNCAKVSTAGDTNPDNDQACVTGKVE